MHRARSYILNLSFYGEFYAEVIIEAKWYDDTFLHYIFQSCTNKNIELPTDNILHYKCSTQIMFKIDNYTIQFD